MHTEPRGDCETAIHSARMSQPSGPRSAIPHVAGALNGDEGQEEGITGDHEKSWEIMEEQQRSRGRGKSVTSVGRMALASQSKHDFHPIFTLTLIWLRGTCIAGSNVRVVTMCCMS